MRVGTKNRGYTIVEVLMFLAISGFMFVTAANFVSGKQSKAEFQQGVNIFNSELNQVINDVGNGYFPSNSDFSCTSAATGAISLDNSSNTAQGSNSGQTGGCTFLGKIVSLMPLNTSGNTYTTYSIAGRQYAGDVKAAEPPTSFAEALPRVVDKLTQTGSVRYGVIINKVTNDGSELGAVGFFNGFSTKDSSGEFRRTKRIDTIVALTRDEAAALAAGSNPALSGYDGKIVTNPNIVICLDGQNGQFATINIGGGSTDITAGQRFATKLKIYTDKAQLPSGVCNV